MKNIRFKQAAKEAMLCIGLSILYFIWWYVWAYGLGSRAVQDYTFIFGLPAWFFFSCVLGFILFSFLAWGMVKFFFKDMPLDVKD